MSFSIDFHEVRDVIVVSIRIVEESSILHKKPSSLLAGSVPAIPPERASSARPSYRLDGQPDVLFLVNWRKPKDLFPTVSVPTDFMAVFNGCTRHFGSFFKRHRA